MKVIGVAVSLLVAFFILRACADGAARAREVRLEESARILREAKRAITPDLIPPIDVRPIDAGAMAKAGKIPEAKHCAALGRALRASDKEFARAMIQRTADMNLGVMRFAQQGAIKQHHILLGMTPCMATASIGRPERINRSVGSYGVHEQWVYPGGYLYFQDDILSSFQN